MNDYYQFRDETGTPIDYYQLVNDNNELCKEIERLNNIINEMEKTLSQTIENSTVKPYVEMCKYLLKELQELKGSGNNE